MRIDVYHTHITVSPYKKGDFFDLEKALSKWNQIRRNFGKYEPVGYFIEGDTLYLPKGVNIDILAERFGVNPTFHRTPSSYRNMSQQYELIYPPRDDTQNSAIKFLSSQDEYSNTHGYCQFLLNLDTSGGKTFCAINAFTILGMKTLIIVNREYLANHWKSEIMKFTNIPDEKIILLSTDVMKKVMEAELEGDVYIVMHQTIQLMARTQSWMDVNEFMSIAGIGLKIYDEAHEFMGSIFNIDCRTSVKKTFYLTATAGRSEKRENKILQLMFSSSCKFSDKMKESEKHINYRVVLYQGDIPQKYVASMKTSKGFSPYKFIKFALNDETGALLDAFSYSLSEALDRPGQILIVSPLKATVNYFMEYVKRIVGSSRTVGTIYSDNDDETNFNNQNCDIICSTIKSCGTGFNPPRLQTIICVEPHMSEIMTYQLKGRLDRYQDGETYFDDLIDKSIPYLKKVQECHLKVFDEVAKSIDVVEI